LRTDELEFRPDSWTSPVFGAEGSGWEAWLNGSEIAQLTYFNRVGDVVCETTPLEITYGLERVFARLNEIDDFSDIRWSHSVSYGDLFDVAEREHSQYNIKVASVERHAQLIDLYLEECKLAISKRLLHPALDFLLKSAHSYNIANNRDGCDEYVGEDTLSTIRSTAKMLAQSYIENE
jgi:glycyl-tRNA synthetase alpha chain